MTHLEKELLNALDALLKAALPYEDAIWEGSVGEPFEDARAAIEKAKTL